jgi:hypothetical protein
MELTPIERMLLGELTRQQQEAVAPIQAKIDAALTAIAERVGIPVEACRINTSTGEILDQRSDDAAEEGE